MLTVYAIFSIIREMFASGEVDLINAIHGSFAGFNENFIYVLTSGGVEYSIEISLLDLDEILSMSDEKKRDLRILTYLVHREDAMLLYGFLREDERKCFTQLLSVNGIGAKQALKVLSSMKVEDFLLALDKSDVKKLSKIPGMGPKTAQKLILQLRNVLILENNDESENKAEQKKSINEYQDLIDAFVEMGHERRQVKDKIERILKENELLLYGKSRSEKETFLFQTLIKGN